MPHAGEKKGDKGGTDQAIFHITVPSVGGNQEWGEKNVWIVSEDKIVRKGLSFAQEGENRTTLQYSKDDNR